MNGNTNIFFGSGNDPLLGTPTNYEAKMQELEQAMRYLEQQRQNLVQMGVGAAQHQPSQPASQTPIWDEIDSITGQMSEKEFAVMSQSEEFAESSNAIAQIVQATQLAQLRPVIEASQQGRDALEKHLTLIKRLRKSAAAEVSKELDEFKEYTEKYSDMPYAEYLKMKRAKKGGKK